MAKRGRPKKLENIDKIQDAEPITCVYSIVRSSDDEPVYVGKTVNLRKRVESYFYPNSCHNLLLKEFLMNNDFYIKVLDKSPKDINNSEKYWIKYYKNQLLNLVGGGEQNWRNHKRKAWMAGQNIHCPSDMILSYLKNRRNKFYKHIKSDIDSLRNSMDDKQRSIYELSLAKSNYGLFKDQIERWLSYTESRLIGVCDG